MALQPGTRLGPYEILASLGAGGMGEVYRARDPKLGREVALKVLPEVFARDPERLARFDREARSLAALNHPGIAAIYGLEESDDTRFLVLELVPGETLEKKLFRGPLPVREALGLCGQIAEALAAAHEKGILHRDLKPSNVHVTPEGKVKLLDFGLARTQDRRTVDSTVTGSPADAATRPGQILGTAAYMSPEQARGKELDRRTDVWSFGCVLYEALTDERAFSGETVSDTLAAVLDREPDWEALPPETPALVRSLLRRCLQKDNARRLHDIADAALEIEEALSAPAGEVGPEPQQVVVTPPVWRRYLYAGVTGLLLLLSVVLGYVIVSDAPPENGVIRFEISPPEGTAFALDPDKAGPVAVSPNGRMLAYSARDAERQIHLYVRSLDATESRALPGTDGARYPFWSPDSGSIGFFADRKLKKVEATGGAPLSLCDALDGRGGSWSPQGVIVFAPDALTVLHRVSDAGGKSAPITQINSERKEISHRHPHFLPDGRQFLYLARMGGRATDDAVVVGSLDGDQDKLLLRSAAASYASGHLLFLREGTLMARPFDAKRLELTGVALQVAENVTLLPDREGRAAFSVSQNGVLAYQTGNASPKWLEWFDREGGSRGTLGETAYYWDADLSGDGAHAVVSVVDSGTGTTDLWIHEIARNLRTRFTFDPGSDRRPVWSPDGREVVFTSNRKGPYDLYRKSRGGSGEEELLLESEVNKWPSSWSPDGELLAFYEWREGTSTDIWILPLDGEHEPYPFLQSHFTEDDGAFSPDGRWMAYDSNESGRWEVYVVPFPGPGRRWQISKNGGAWPEWRGDGREIFYRELNGSVMAVEVEARDETFVVGAAQELFEMSPLVGHPGLAATPDGQQFLVVTAGEVQDPGPLTLVVNWTAALKK